MVRIRWSGKQDCVIYYTASPPNSTPTNIDTPPSPLSYLGIQLGILATPNHTPDLLVLQCQLPIARTLPGYPLLRIYAEINAGISRYAYL